MRRKQENKCWLSQKRFVTAGIAAFMLSAAADSGALAQEAVLEVEAQVSESAPQKAKIAQESDASGKAAEKTAEAKKTQEGTEQNPSETAPANDKGTKQQESESGSETEKAPTPANTEAPETEKAPTPVNTEAPETEKAPAPANTEAPETEKVQTSENTEAPETEKVQTSENTEAPETEKVQTSENTEAPETEKVPTPANTEAPETEKITESGPEETTEGDALLEKETETETEQERETEAEARLEASVKQELFAESDQSLSVKYTVTVVNQANAGEAKGMTVKAVLGRELSCYDREGQSAGLNCVENLSQIPDGLDLKELSGLSGEQLQDYGSAVIWTDETLPAGEKKEYVFYAHVGEDAVGTQNLPAMFFADGEQIGGNRIQWINGELLAQKEENETEAYLPAEYSIQASWEGETLGVGDTITLTALTGEENVPVFWEIREEDGSWSVIAEGETYAYELTMENYEKSFRAVSGS